MFNHAIVVLMKALLGNTECLVNPIHTEGVFVSVEPKESEGRIEEFFFMSMS